MGNIEDDGAQALPNEAYTVGWICALATEYTAARAFLDKEYGRPEFQSPHDNNTYTVGEIRKHKVVIAVMPAGEYGTASASSVARDMLHSFPNIRIGLMVGIGGGAPSSKHDIRLGDVVVSIPGDGAGGVFQYDFGKTIQNQEFQNTSFLNQPPTLLRSAVNGLKAEYESEGHEIVEAIEAAIARKPRLRKNHSRPDPTTDRLYASDFIHQDDSCCTKPDDDALSHLVQRDKRGDDEDDPTIHYGLIASANSLMKDALIRDKLAADEGVLCFEMEAAGLMNHFPCLVIRGICDYSDTHKNKIWQGYAAMTAAAYTKDLLNQITPSTVHSVDRISESVRKDVSDTLANVKSIKSAVEDLNLAVMAEKTQQDTLELLGWISDVDYGPQQSEFLERRQLGTGQWVIESLSFKNWYQKRGDTLLCQGNPGVGKTIITSIVIQHLEAQFREEEEVAVVYIYHSFNMRGQQRMIDLIASLLKQLCQKRLSIPPEVKKLYQDHQRNKTRPPVEELVKVLQTVIKLYEKVFIISDALDECQTASGCRNQYLSEIFNLQTKTKINFFATSRPISDIVGRFKNTLQIRAQDEDIRKYLEANLVELSNVVQENVHLQEEIVGGITNAANGMFLLVQLYLRSLVGLDTPNSIRQTLTQMITDSKNVHAGQFQLFDRAYESEMERIEKRYPAAQRRAKQILSWITLSKRPLSDRELRHALAVQSGMYDLKPEDIPHIDSILSACESLITIDEKRSVRLVHQTTQDYFERTQDRWFPDAHKDLATACITYISFDVFACGIEQDGRKLRSRNRRYPFYNYAAVWWGHHARLGGTDDLVNEFLRKPNHILTSVQELICSAKHGYKKSDLLQVEVLHLVARYGLTKAMKKRLKSKKLDARDHEGKTPLCFAAEHGHDDIVKLLLSTEQVNVESRDIWGRRPLHYAAENGHKTTVQLLLRTALVEPDPRDSKGITPLSSAVKQGHYDIAQLLLATKRVDPDSRDHQDCTPLSHAATEGHEGLVRMLLATGRVNPDLKDKESFTPFSRAVDHANVPVAKLLLADSRVNPDNIDGNGWNPIYSAAMGGDDNIIGMLLADSRVDPNFQDADHGDTPLMCAAEQGHEAAFQLLLAESRVDPNLRSHCGETALHYAVDNGYEAIVSLLAADPRVDVNVRENDFGQTPISIAAEKGEEAMIQFLLANTRADPNLPDHEGQVPLYHAIAGGHDGISLLLISDHRIKLNVQDDMLSQTPLVLAIDGRKEEVARILLSYVRVDPGIQDWVGATALHYAAEKGFEELVQLLISDARVSLNHRDNHGRTALYVAASEASEAVVRLLLADERIDPNLSDQTGITPLINSASEGHSQIVQLFLADSRVDPNAQDESCYTATLAAAEAGHGDIVRLLMADHRVNLGLQTSEGELPLALAAENGHILVVEQLLSSDVVDVNSVDAEGYSALFSAAMKGQEAVVQLLLERGANPSLGGLDGLESLKELLAAHENVVEPVGEPHGDEQESGPLSDKNGSDKQETEGNVSHTKVGTSPVTERYLDTRGSGQQVAKGSFLRKDYDYQAAHVASTSMVPGIRSMRKPLESSTEPGTALGSRHNRDTSYPRQFVDFDSILSDGLGTPAPGDKARRSAIREGAENSRLGRFSKAFKGLFSD